MRFMEIPPFSDAGAAVSDFADVCRARLTSGLSTAGPIGVQLLGYMIEPDWEHRRENATRLIREGLRDEEAEPLRERLETLQRHWAGLTDILQLHHAICVGEHQKHRGGASVGKAIHLVAHSAEAKGTGAARLWTVWKANKDVAHLAAASVLMAANMMEHHKRGSLGANLQQLLPFRVVLLVPEFVLGLAITIQQYGLEYCRNDETAPLFDPETLWRIPDIGVVHLSFPPRILNTSELAILNARRAGNRGQRSHHETTPIP
jgi:hypothetical protein